MCVSAMGHHEFFSALCPLYPRKRTFAVHYAMSALGQTPTLHLMTSDDR